MISRLSDLSPSDVPSINTIGGSVDKCRASHLKSVFNDALHGRIKTVEDFHRRIIEAENSKPLIKKLSECLSSITTHQTEKLITQNPAIMILLEKGLDTCSLKEAENMETVLLKILEGSPKFLIIMSTILGRESPEYTYRMLLKARRVKGSVLTEIFNISKVAISQLPLNKRQAKLFQELINKEIPWEEAEKKLEITPTKEEVKASSLVENYGQVLKRQEELTLKELCAIEKFASEKPTAEQLKESLPKIWDARMCSEIIRLIKENLAFVKFLERELATYAPGEKNIKAAFWKILENSPNFLITTIAMLPHTEVQNIYMILRSARIIKGSELKISNAALDLLPLETAQKEVLKEHVNKQVEPNEAWDFQSGLHCATAAAWFRTEKALNDVRNHVDLSTKLEDINIEKGSPTKKSKGEMS